MRLSRTALPVTSAWALRVTWSSDANGNRTSWHAGLRCKLRNRAGLPGKRRRWMSPHRRSRIVNEQDDLPPAVCSPR